MITPMKKISICGVKDSRKAVLETLQKHGAVQIVKSENTDDTAKHLDVSESIAIFDRYIATSKKAIEILDEISPEKKGLFSVRKVISIDKYSMNSSETTKFGSIASEVLSKKKQIDENILSIGKYRTRIEAMSVWHNLDVPINQSGTEYTKSYMMSAPLELDPLMIDEILGDLKEYVYFEIIYTSKNLSNVFFVILKSHEQEVIRVLRENAFSAPQIGLSRRTPSDKTENIKEKISALEAHNKEILKEIEALSKNRDDIKLFYDHLVLRKEKYLNLQNLLITDEAFFIEGYIPERISGKIKDILEKKAMCAVEFEDIAPDEEAPVLFKNNSFVSPVESITSDYAMPSKHDIDPNAVMSIFYYGFFGMMFSDAGYGLLMMLVCGFLGFFAKVEKSTKQFMRMFFYCGVSTFIWGLMFGSFFGDAIKSLKPIWINPVEEPLLLLIFSIGLGLVQILVGLICKFYVDYRAGEKTAAIFDSGSWILILFGAAAGCAGAFLKLSPIKTIGISLAVIGVFAVILMRGRSNKNIILRLFNGIIGLYDVTSYVSDLLSYSRLMALGLATGVIGQVVNVMCSLMGDSFVGMIFVAIIFIIGHALNFAINILGAYVHTNRLQYVEFYSKFYEGGGKKFTPLSMNTKYFNFMEDDEKC